MESRKNILFCVMNWGLGHASRSTPLIKSLIEEGNQVFIASDGAALTLLEKNFPENTCLKLAPYNIKYSASNSQLLTMMFQVPSIFNAISKEHYDVANYVDKYEIDSIISDNRFGCFHKKIHSTIITHQTNIKVPTKSNWIRKMVNKTNRFYINEFNELWIPDFEEEKSLSGELSDLTNIKTPVKYLGVLSSHNLDETIKVNDKIAVILSGPEPQRGILDKKLTRFFEQKEHQVTLVKGQPDKDKKYGNKRNLTTKAYLTGKELETLLNESKIIIARAGYSTIMDVVKLNKKAILIPTPGQSEQEYLGERLQNRDNIRICKQSEIEEKLENLITDLS